ncbi:hypothetical protein B9Z55_011592 [Caenorhabditis nigoni]|uniref:Uncharacterized protein n=1 Tax=Caenorhabditis nigoni TaxID=1611254 RepID=A0A2G5ULB7_9PELO|nr:hypothetical protein B9Z55_011592 [Caenorhabditis nigoni]
MAKKTAKQNTASKNKSSHSTPGLCGNKLPIAENAENAENAEFLLPISRCRIRQRKKCCRIAVADFAKKFRHPKSFLTASSTPPQQQQQKAQKKKTSQQKEDEKKTIDPRRGFFVKLFYVVWSCAFCLLVSTATLRTVALCLECAGESTNVTQNVTITYQDGFL